MQILLLVLIFLAVLFGLFGVWLLIGGRDSEKRRVQLRLRGVQQIKDYELGESLAKEEEAKEKARNKRREIVRRQAFSDIPSLDQRLSKTPWAQKLSGMLREAELPLTVNTFALICVACAALGVCVGVVWNRLVLAPVMGLALGAAPYVYVIMAVRKRLKLFGRQFPDALDMLSSSVKGGLALNAAIQNVADEMPDPTGDEFKILADELTFGVDISEALRRLASRVDCSDVRFFCAALMIQKETGGNLAEVLDGLQRTIRERFRILGQLKTLTAQGRLSGWILAALPIALGGIIYMANPDYMRYLVADSMGHKLLIAAGFFELVGFLLIRKIVNIRV